MALNETRIEDTKKSIESYIVNKIFEETGYTKRQILNQFVLSRTHELLMDTNTGLYLESPTLVLELYRAEINNNEERFNWLLDPNT